jgi:hypothetical protein
VKERKGAGPVLQLMQSFLAHEPEPVSVLGSSLSEWPA